MNDPLARPIREYALHVKIHRNTGRIYGQQIGKHQATACYMPRRKMSQESRSVTHHGIDEAFSSIKIPGDFQKGIHPDVTSADIVLDLLEDSKGSPGGTV